MRLAIGYQSPRLGRSEMSMKFTRITVIRANGRLPAFVGGSVAVLLPGCRRHDDAQILAAYPIEARTSWKPEVCGEAVESVPFRSWSVRFLIDNALSPLLAVRLRQGGHDAAHVLDLGLADAKDRMILASAQKIEFWFRRTRTSALAALSSEKTSLILFRGESNARRSVKQRSSWRIGVAVGLLQQGCVAVWKADAWVRMLRSTVTLGACAIGGGSVTKPQN